MSHIEVEIEHNMEVIITLAAGKGEKGDKGDPGDEGPKGDKGDKGDPGEGANITGVLRYRDGSDYMMDISPDNGLLMWQGTGIFAIDVSEFGNPFFWRPINSGGAFGAIGKVSGDNRFQIGGNRDYEFSRQPWFNGQKLLSENVGPLIDAADDAAAAAAGVGVNKLYRTGSVVKIRVA